MYDDYRKPSPEPAKSGGFIYDGGGLTVGNITRASVADLKLLFRKNASSQRKRQATKAWVTAQLQLYGIPFEKGAKAAELKTALESAVQSRKFAGPTVAITSLEHALDEKWRENIRIRDIKAAEQKALDFAKCTTPEAEVSLDPERFVSKHFLDDNGKPARQKTSAIILRNVDCGELGLREIVSRVPGLALHDCSDAQPWICIVAWKEHLTVAIDATFTSLQHERLDLDTCRANFDLDRFLALHFLDRLRGGPDPTRTKAKVKLYPWFQRHLSLNAAAKKIPGLHVCTATDGCILIGWGREKVEAEKHQVEEEMRIAKQKEVERQAKDQQDDWDHLWRGCQAKHREYLACHQTYHRTGEKEGPGQEQGPMTLHDIAGSYVVRAKEIEAGWNVSGIFQGHCIPDGTDSSSTLSFTLDISKPTSWEAEDDADGCEADFAFGLIEGTMILALSDDKLHAFRRCLEADSEPEEDEPEPVFASAYGGLGKRRAEQAAPPKLAIRRKLGENPVPGKVYLQWAGADPGTGDMEEDIRSKSGLPSHVGFLTYSPCRTQATGEWQYPGMFGGDRPVHLELLKVSDTAKGTSTSSGWKDWHRPRYW